MIEVQVQLESSIVDMSLETTSLSEFRELVQKVTTAFLSGFFTENLPSYPCSQVFLAIQLVENDTIKQLNSEHRGKDKVTDVLSFPVYEDLRSEREEILPGPLEMGDIVISVDVAKIQAVSFKITLEEELLHLIGHGLMHLLGFDHEISTHEREIMELQESIFLETVQKLRI